MKLIHLLMPALLLGSLAACHKSDQPTPAAIAGTWTGTYEVQPLGSCTESGENPVKAIAQWQVNGSTITGDMARIYNTGSRPHQFTGTVNGTQVRIIVPTGAVCNGSPLRWYNLNYEGTIQGNTLTLMVTDSVCPTMGCIFRRIYKLTKQ